MSPDVWKSHNNIQTPLPPQVQVRWRSPDGVTHRKEIKVPEPVPRNFRGRLVFEIKKGGRVEVRVQNEG